MLSVDHIIIKVPLEARELLEVTSMVYLRQNATANSHFHNYTYYSVMILEKYTFSENGKISIGCVNILTRNEGSYMQLHQCMSTGTVVTDLPYNIKITCMSSVETFAIEIKIFDWQKVCLIIPSKALDCLIFYGSKVQLQPCVFDPLIFTI